MLKDICEKQLQAYAREMQLGAEDFLIKVDHVLKKLPEDEQKSLVKTIKNRKLTGGKLLLLAFMWTIVASGIAGATRDSYSFIEDLVMPLVVLPWLYVWYVGLRWTWRKIRKTPIDAQKGAGEAREKVLAMRVNENLKEATADMDLPTEVQNSLELNGNSWEGIVRLKSAIDSKRVELEAVIERNLSGEAEALPNSA